MPTEPTEPSESAPLKILFLCHTLPYPPDGGVWIRTYNIFKELAKAFEVTVLCFERLGTAKQSIDTDASVEHMKSLAEFEYFSLPQNHSRVTYVTNHLKSVLSRRVYTRYIYESADYHRRIRELIAERDFDLVHVDSLDLSAYLGDCGDVPIACTHHNVESALLERRSKVEGTPLGSAYIRQQARWMAKEERHWAPKVAMNVLCSSIDRDLLQEMVPGSPAAVIPNGVDIEEFQPLEAEATGSSFVGATSWFPNLDALEYFAQEILPLVHRELPDHPVHWVGSATDEQKARFRALGVELTGYVDDVRTYMAGATTFVVPLRAGGGTRLKILNAWSMGCAVVSTSIGCEGLDAVDGENILVRDDPASFAQAVIDLERDDDLRARLGRAARKTAEDVYSWSVIGKDLVALYRDVAAGRIDSYR